MILEFHKSIEVELKYLTHVIRYSRTQYYVWFCLLHNVSGLSISLFIHVVYSTIIAVFTNAETRSGAVSKDSRYYNDIVLKRTPMNTTVLVILKRRIKRKISRYISLIIYTV